MNKRAGAAPTIIDVARHAGVSIKTVSRVMNKEPTVHADTRARVQEAVAALNYRPQLSARSLAGAKSFLIGLLYYDPSAAFVAGVQQGATLGCREAGRHLVVESLRRDDGHMHAQIEAMLAALRPDGMILTPPLCDDPEILEVLRANRTPCVLISPGGEGHGMAAVRMDDTLAAEELTNLLISLGHKDIAFIEGNQSASERRRAGYERALKAHRIPVDKHLIMPGNFQFEAGVAAAQALFASAKPPTAIFAANDDMALGALTAAQRLGIAVPHDVAIVGFDDSRAATLVWPELTNLLISLGHTAIAFIEGDQSASDRRRHGYERALKSHRIAADPALVVAGSFDFDSGVAAAQQLFALPRPPTAIFAANDDKALGALTAAQRLGIAVPHDVAIVGFDDSRAATLVWPELTTVRQPLAEMAMAAVDMLLAGAARPGELAPVRVLPHEVVVRGSTAAPAKGRS